MFSKSPLGLAIAALIAAPLCAHAEIEVSAVIKNETAFWLKSDPADSERRTVLDDDGHSAGDVMKFENSARIFINGDLGEESSWHAELRPVFDSKGVNDDYTWHKNYTQNDYLRELYADTTLGDWDLRVGKQQVVWGTADGIKLLDIINPTDYRELNQNAVEDARIPIWMVNAEHTFDNGGNLQLILSQVEENKFPGLNASGDADQPFIPKGVDAITGRVNGFRHVAPALAGVATTFTMAEDFGAFNPFGGGSGIGLVPFTNLSVDAFASTTWNLTAAPGKLFPAAFGGAIGVGSDSVTVDNPAAENGFVLLNGLAQNGISFAGAPAGTGATLQNNNVTNLMAIDGSDKVPATVAWRAVGGPTSAFEYMPNATFATFNTFSGNNDPAFFGGSGGISGIASHGPMVTRYKRDYPETANANAGFRWRNSTDGGLNYSVNYFYHYDANPVVDLSYHDAVTGEELTTELRARGTVLPNPAGFPVAPALPDGALVSRNSPTLNTAGGGATVLLRNGANQYYGATNPDAFGTLGSTLSPNGVELRFTETLNRIHSLGASFDYAFETDFAPVVVRGEFLYDKDTMQPVVDKRLLSIGDLEGALRPEEADFFKYVIGVDVTVMTNLLVSGQFIQFRNLDFENDKRTCTTAFGQSFDCSRYTADPATLNLTNGLQKGWKNKEFYSLFLSKPFGPNQLGRANNIIIFEEGGGYWNRLDAEYSLSDELIVTGEVNLYWGDEDTTFGQFKNSSNIQVGFKYIIE